MIENTRYYVRQITPGNTRLFSFQSFPITGRITSNCDKDTAIKAIKAVRDLWPDSKYELVMISTRTHTVDETHPEQEAPGYNDLIIQVYELKDKIRAMKGEL